MKTLFLFPGAHKTGTTLLQSSLEVNRANLDKEGLSIACRQAFYSSGLHPVLKTAGGIDTLSAQEIHDRLVHVFNGAPRDRVVISIENIGGEVNPKGYGGLSNVVDNLKILFPDHLIRVFFFVRRQDTFIESAFVQAYQAGLFADCDAFVQRFLRKPLDWLRPVRRMSAALTPWQVEIIPYELIHQGAEQYISLFFRKFSEQDPEIFVATYRKAKPFTNLSISAKGIEMLGAAYSDLRSREERRRLARALQVKYGTDKYPRFRLPDTHLVALASLHRDLNRRLVKRGKFSPEMAEYYTFGDNVRVGAHLSTPRSGEEGEPPGGRTTLT